MDFESIFEFLQTFWVVWLAVLFVGVCLWAYWPSRRRRMEKYGRIPLEDGDEEHPSGDGGPTRT